MPAQSTPPTFPEQVDARPLARRGVAIPGYWVSSDGRVWTQWREERDGLGRMRWAVAGEARPLVPSAISRGGKYLGVSLRFGGKTIRASVHTLVMAAFVGPCPDGLEVCHEDGDGHNNRLGNLRYDTKPANHADRVRHGTHHKGQRNPAAKLTDWQAGEIRRLRAEGVKLKDIAELFGVRESTVSRIANGIRRAV